jgi:hypothetical protein
MEKVIWQDKKTNEEVLIAVSEERCVVQAIQNRKRNWTGHARGNSMLKLVIEGRMLSKEPTSRPMMSMIEDLKEASYTGMKRRAEDRD